MIPQDQNTREEENIFSILIFFRRISWLLIALLLMTVGRLTLKAQPQGYAHAKQVTVDANQVSGSSALINYPMLFSVTDNDLRSTANGGQVQSSNGYDIIFTLEDCSVILDHEIELYDPVTGQLIAWVRIPSLSATTNTVINLFYGNASVSANPSSTATWSGIYENVFHMNQDPSGTAPQLTESTANARHATSIGSMTNSDVVTGQIGSALDFDGMDDELNASSTSVNDNTITWSTWVNLDGLQDQNDGFTGLLYHNTGINIMPDNEIRLNWNSSFTTATNLIVPTSQWAYVAVALDGPSGIADIYVGNGGTISTFQYSGFFFNVFDDLSTFRIANQDCCGGR